MQLKPLIDKILDHSSLTDDERSALQQFDPDLMLRELAESRSRIEAVENEKLSHEERLQKELELIRNEHALLQNDHAALQRRCKIEKLSDRFGCVDPDYLDFRASRSNVDLDDENAVNEFAEKLARTAPNFFKARINPGSDIPVTLAGHSEASEFTGDRIGRITVSLAEV